MCQQSAYNEILNFNKITYLIGYYIIEKKLNENESYI